MKLVGIVIVAAAMAGAAHAAPAGQRDLPPGVSEAAGDAFGQARDADQRGDLNAARRLYQTAYKLAPHPNTAYNLADVERRLKLYPEAVTDYQRYLSLSPDAGDRPQVEAMIEELKHAPGALTIEANPESGKELAFVDGEPVGMLPVTIDLAAGPHAVDVITPTSYAWMTCHVHGGQQDRCHPAPVPREDGNVVIGVSIGLDSNRWRDNGAFFMTRERFQIRHGRYSIENLHHQQCAPFSLEVPPGEDNLTYVYVSTPPVEHHGNDCWQLTVKQRAIKF